MADIVAEVASATITTVVTVGIAGLLAIVALTAPEGRAQTAKPPEFEVASVKPTPPGSSGLTNIGPYGTDRFTATDISMELLIGLAFEVPDSQILGAPGWLVAQHYDIVAKAEDGSKLTYQQLKPRLQQLLAQRFKLEVHRQTKEVSGYALVVAKGGPKLKTSEAETTAGGMIFARGLRNPNASMEVLAGMLARPLGRPVVDKTGLDGKYDIVLNYAPDEPPDPSLPSIFTALQEQLGLKLEPLKVPMEMLVIDRVEKLPTEN